MTLNGAIMQLVQMRESEYMPEMFKPLFDKVIETVSECEEPGTSTAPQWIPVSERLPEENMWTICQNNAGAMMIGKYDIEFGWMFPAYFDGIIAWQPLPAPYREQPDQEGDA